MLLFGVEFALGDRDDPFLTLAKTDNYCRGLFGKKGQA